MGSHNHGQGHETVFRQIVFARLGIPPERIRFVNGDTDLVTHGRGTIGSAVHDGGWWRAGQRSRADHCPR